MLVTAAAATVLAAAEEAPRPQAPRINIGGIVNAASNRPAPDNYLAPGAIFSIYGTGLSDGGRTGNTSISSNGILPESLDRMWVLFGAAYAPLFYVSPTQLNAQVPAFLQPGTWEVRVVVDQLVASEKVVVREYSPGLFGGARHTDGRLVDRDAPARPGEYILFFGTGFGPTRPVMQTGYPARELAPMTSPVEARIGEVMLQPEDIYYAGLAWDFAGLYQFNLRVPATAPSGDLEVTIKAGQEWSQAGMRIAVQR